MVWRKNSTFAHPDIINVYGCDFPMRKMVMKGISTTQTDHLQMKRSILIAIAALLLCAGFALTLGGGQNVSDNDEARPRVTLSTNYGDIVVELYNETPLHRDNFLKRVDEGYYDSLLFHRVIESFMIQSGDSTSRHAPSGTMIADETPEVLIPAEFRYPQLFHKRGALAAARESDDVNPEQCSSCSQFYIVWGKIYPTGSDLDRMDSVMWARTHGRNHLDPALRKYYRRNPGTPSLDGSYTVFGEVVEGLDIVGMIQRTETDDNDRPIEDIRILKATRSIVTATH